MKKIIALFVAISVYLVLISAYAEPTHKRGVIEFCELYMYRLMTLQYENDLEYSIHILEPHSPSMSYNDDTVLLHSVAGSIEMNTSDYTVNKILMTFVDLNDTDQDNEQNAMSSIIALSVLEYNEMDELKLRVYSKLSGGSETATEEAIRILNEELSPVIVDAMQEAVETDEEIKVYSGNYDYYIAHNSGKRDNGDEYEYFYLIARAHE